MGLFDDLDVASAADDPFKVADGWHPATLTKVEIKDTRDMTKKGLALEYEITGGENKGSTISEWKNYPRPADPKNPTADEKRDLAFIKARLLSLEVPETKMNSLNPEDIIGTEVYIKMTTKGEYQNITDLKVNDGSMNFDGESEGGLFG